MSAVRERGESIRRFVLENVAAHPADIARVTAEHFGSTRQAVNRHLKLLVEQGLLVDEGQTRRKVYRLATLTAWRKEYPLVAPLAEDVVWRTDIAPLLGLLPKNAMDIWHYGFTEMFNNAIDHSAASTISVDLKATAASVEIMISDDGVGIFKKIQAAMGLLDERHAVLEIAKGKCTTDPRNHTGEGIFFSSRMFDRFDLLSGDVFFSHEIKDVEDWIIQPRSSSNGTRVRMVLNSATDRTSVSVFDRFASSSDDYGFSKTVVPVRLMQYGDDNLVSRSQARRLLMRFDRFAVVILDFAGVSSVGQAFADEVFRVFKRQHSGIDIHTINANASVLRMISRALSQPPLDPQP